MMKDEMGDRYFYTSDQKYGCRLSAISIQKMMSTCAQSPLREVGGILVGYYSDDNTCAIITDASFAPKDSKRGSTWFVRGVWGIQSWLNRLWQHSQSQYYLGEWHFHPGGIPQPSRTDLKQMTAIASSQQYQCPEPLLVIIGGTPPADSTMKTFIFFGGQYAELFENKNHKSDDYFGY